jgi:hypothetical protein
MKACDIEWVVSDSEILEKLDEMTTEGAAEILGLSPQAYDNMTDEERHNSVLEYFHRRHVSWRADFVGLPSEVELDDIFNSLSKEDVIDWLEQQYGNYVEDCNLEG